jgi:radical SAM protein with 4Fe4S-binding SPASM domain
VALKHVTLDGVRLHLKTDEMKLWVNGYYILFLNKTASAIFEAFIDSCYEVPREKIVETTINKITKKFKVNKETAEKDLHQLIGIVNSLARNEIPTHLIGVKNIECGSKTAPNRMDLSLSYNCNNRCSFCYLPKNENENGTLATWQWKQVIHRLWKIGIPQIVFTGGECTLRDDLLELVRFSKEFVTGIISNGTNITPELAKDLKKADLDWIQITLETPNPTVHDEMQGRKGAWKETVRGIRNCVDAGLQVSINATLTKENFVDLPALIRFAKKLGVGSVSTNAIIRAGRGIKAKDSLGLSEEVLKKTLIEAKEVAKKEGIGFNWFLPTCYKKLNPVELGFGQRACSACSINMMVEPNGDVIPCQSWTGLKLGNILNDKWESIWNKKEAQEIRASRYADPKCQGCKYFSMCKGACPLDKLNGCYRGV